VNAYAAVYSVAPRISGPSSICQGSSGSLTFTVTNPPANYTWTCSSNLTPGTISGNSRTFTISNASNSAWVAINSATTELARYFISIIAPPVVSYIDGPEDVPLHGSGTYFPVLSSGTGPFTYSWFMEPFTGYNLTDWNEYAYVSFSRYDPWSYVLNLTISNSCGSDFPFKYITYGGSKSGSNPNVYPNPVSDILTVEIKSEKNNIAGTKASGNSATFDIRLYDGQGTVLRQQKTGGGTVQFNVADLLNGIYYLHIYDGVNEKPNIHQIVVEH
jgi:hypothetical protein